MKQDIANRRIAFRIDFIQDEDIERKRDDNRIIRKMIFEPKKSMIPVLNFIATTKKSRKQFKRKVKSSWGKIGGKAEGSV